MFKKLKRLGLVGMMVLGISTSIFANTSSGNNEHKEYLGYINEGIISEDTKREIREMLNIYNISEEVQDRLIRKLENGQQWDCMDKSKVAQIPSDYFDLSPDNPVKRYTFPDGSIIEKSIDFSEAEIDVIESNDIRGSISGGTTSSGTGYFSVRGARISTQKGFVGMGFYVDYTNTNKGYDYISNVYDGYVKVVGGSSSVPTLTIDKSKEDANGAAQATLKAQVSWAGGVAAGGTEWLKVHVGDDTVWTSEN